MEVIQFGAGKKNLVIISGVSLCGLDGQEESIAAAYDLFTEQYTIYLFEREKRLEVGTSVKDMADSIFAELMARGISYTDVYGVSQGGMIALCLAAYHPELVGKMVLCSSQCKATPRMKEVAKKWQNLAAEKDVVALNRYFFSVVYSPAFLESVKDSLPVLEQKGTAEDCERFEILAKACEEFDITDDLEKVICPTLVIGDVNDQTIGPEGSYEIAKALSCEIYMYETYSHAVFDEASDIKDRILEFLKK